MTTTKPAKLPPTPDPRCGSSAGYSAHWRRGESACPGCQDAHREATREANRRFRSTPQGREAHNAANRRFQASPEGREAHNAANRRHRSTPAGLEANRKAAREGNRVARDRRRARTPEKADADFLAKWPDGKPCQSCGEILPATAFYRNSTEIDGRERRCMPCTIAHQAAKRWAKLEPTWLSRGLSPSVCGYCLTPIGPGNRHVDHFHPVAKGGPDRPDN